MGDCSGWSNFIVHPIDLSLGDPAEGLETYLYRRYFGH